MAALEESLAAVRGESKGNGGVERCCEAQGEGRRPRSRPRRRSPRRRRRRRLAPSKGTEVTVGKRKLKLTNLDKVLYPKAGFTKGEVIDYYARVADTMIPHLRGRPTTLKRYPDGVEGFNFFEKRSPKHRPDWVKTATVLADRVGEIDFTLVDNKPTLVWLAQLASLELHPSLAKASKIEVPTVIAFDLDPGPAGRRHRLLPASRSACATSSATSAWSASPRSRARRACRSTSP